VVGISQLVPAELRAVARIGAVGFHPTLLPEGRGRAPVAWTILLNRPAAVNLFFLTDEADAGDLIVQRPVPVLPEDYAGDLIARTNAVLEDVMAEFAPAFASGQVPRIPQDHARATYYARRRPEDGRIDWNQSAGKIYTLVRATSRPYPGAFTFVDGRKVIVWRARPIAAGTPAKDAGVAPPAETLMPAKDAGLRHDPGEPGALAAQAGVAPKSGMIIGFEGGSPLVQTASGLLALTDMEWVDQPAVPLQVGQKLE